MSVLKTSTVLAIVLTFAVPAVSVQHQPSGAQPAQQSQGDAHHPNLPAVPATNNQATNCYQQSREDKPHGWYKFVTWPEGITALAIVFTLGAIVWQAIETRRSVAVGKRSILLQETAYKQWVVLQGWESKVTQPNSKLTVSVTLTNPTNFPLTLKEVHLTLTLSGSNTSFYLICKDRLLAPKEPVEIVGSISITLEHVTSYNNNGLGVLVKGETTFQSIMKKIETVRFQGVLKCGTGMTTFEYTPANTNHQS